MIWAAVQRFYDNRNEAAQCRERFTIAYGAWATAIRRGKLRVTPSNYPRKYDWRAVQAYYNEGHSHRQCMRQFGAAAPPGRRLFGAVKSSPGPRRGLWKTFSQTVTVEPTSSGAWYGQDCSKIDAASAA